MVGFPWVATFDLLHFFKVELIVVLFISSCFAVISVGCCQTTSGIGGSLVISFVSGLSHAGPE